MTNLNRLIAHKMSVDAIPPHGGFADGVKYLTSPNLGDKARAASEWCKAAIAVVRLAKEPNRWKHASDEEIAGEILRQVDERNAAKRKA